MSVAEPIFFKVTEGVTLAVEMLPLGVAIAEIPASVVTAAGEYVKFDVEASLAAFASVVPFGEVVLAVKVCAAAV